MGSDRGAAIVLLFLVLAIVGIMAAVASQMYGWAMRDIRLVKTLREQTQDCRKVVGEDVGMAFEVFGEPAHEASYIWATGCTPGDMDCRKKKLFVYRMVNAKEDLKVIYVPLGSWGVVDVWEVTIWSGGDNHVCEGVMRVREE